MRALSPEEQALWAKVTETIRPLSREPKSSPAGGGGPPKAVEGVSRVAGPLHHPADGPLPRAGEEPRKARPIIANTLDSSWDRRLRSGAVQPDRVVDLHGHGLEGAWQAIDRAIEQALVNHERLLLLITGHARPGDPPVQRGRIRAAVHDWLAASRHRGQIAAVRGAHRRHGGGGSLYVILRR